MMGRWLSRQPLRSLYIHRESPRDILQWCARGVHSPPGCTSGPTPGRWFLDMCERDMRKGLISRLMIVSEMNDSLVI